MEYEKVQHQIVQHHTGQDWYSATSKSATLSSDEKSTNSVQS